MDLKTNHQLKHLESRHTIVRQEHVISYLQKNLAWFIIDYFGHNLDLNEQAGQIFRPQKTDDETVLAEQSDCFWDPDWSHESFF